MPMKSYTCPPEGFQFTQDMKDDYDNNGYLLVKGLFSKEEIKHVENALTSGPFDNYKFALLGGEVYHYHTKVMMKSAKTAGGNIWHQDYGYWYTYGFVYPRMLTVFIAIDKCMKINGCLQILKGSHKVGRLDHSLKGGQLGISDMDRLDEIKKTCPLEYVELEEGDGVFFDCNLIHCSSNNDSDNRRWAFLSAFNKADNKMVYEETAKQRLGHGKPISKVPDSAVLECKDISNMEGKDFTLTKDRPHPTRAVGTEQK